MSADLMSHVRYPTDLMKVQRSMLGVYHVDDARSFFQQDNGGRRRTIRRTRGAAAAVLPDDEDARAGFPDLLDVHEFHPGIPGRASTQCAHGYLAVDSTRAIRRARRARTTGDCGCS